MKRRITTVLLLLTIIVQTLVPTAGAAVHDTNVATQQEITNAIYALQNDYPDGMTWTNQNPSPGYQWVFPGSLWNMGGCAAFAAIIQDNAIGSYKDFPPTWQHINGDCRSGGVHECSVPYAWENLWPGDIIRFEGHSVIVVEKHDDYVIIAEGNYAGRVKWGRKLTKTGIENSATYIITRFSKTEPLMPYIDLPEPGHWSYAAVTWAIVNKIAAPISETKFAPKQECSRADVISFLWAASGCPEPELTELPFTDVSAEAMYRKAVLWALEQGITSGTTETTFTPERSCTRCEALTFFWRAVGSPSAESEDIIFDDVGRSKYYFSSVAWAAEQHITSGTSETTFSPGRTVTRAEALAFAYLAKNP